ncbi:hypothetical protein A2311_01105 [candidate division WOR-1 bacterium RIFOXYB2_FULL_48_7]|uniref:Lipocalin-like domain-containing protein n=1 Tax=candidate division WOR-1 bacterium RIFOXYB2_FULL_48_7 TaxID=1802583 RepID=A0A1F4TP13_UNCSA|nr:MAG: hypothetical protein A2311_01105 [candidate division WOR-1 bacterium RIFOXYB2_FULL_48_7]
MKYACLVILLVGALISPPVEAKGDEWRQYRGAWFEISYPDGFSIQENLPSATSDNGFDDVFFLSPDKQITFYVFSPQWSGTPDERIWPNLNAENIIKKFIKEDGEITSTFFVVRAKDGSYWRIIEDQKAEETNTRRTFAFKYKDKQSYEKYRHTYEVFKGSLIQEAD